jgi:PadR family transcriptional regulator, regulatory protein PadR
MTDEIREPTYLTLTALADQRRHGYGIIKEVARLSGGRTALKAGSLYAMLDRLTSEGMVSVASEEIVEGRLRRYYELTAHGSEVLAEESRRRVSISKTALRRLKLAGGWS